MKLLIVLLCFLPLLTFAQNSTVERPDKAIEPNPYQAVYFADNNDYSKMKSIVIIHKKKYNGFRSDTSQIEYFENGLKMKTISYRNNQPEYTTTMTYNDNQTLNNWVIAYPKYSTKNYYEYDDKKRIITTRQVYSKIKQGKIDSTEVFEVTFKYDDELGLIAIKRKTDFGVGVETYEYNNNKQLTALKNSSIPKIFTYDDNGNISIIQEYMGRIAPEMLMDYKQFEFDENHNLIADSIVTSNNRTKNLFQKTQYFYNGNHQLEKMKVIFDNLYRNVSFEYIDNKIQTITVETNGQSAYLKTWMPYQLKNYYSFPITYTEVFEYDDYGNKTAKRIFVGEELFSEVEFLIEYDKD